MAAATTVGCGAMTTTKKASCVSARRLECTAVRLAVQAAESFRCLAHNCTQSWGKDPTFAVLAVAHSGNTAVLNWY